MLSLRMVMVVMIMVMRVMMVMMVILAMIIMIPVIPHGVRNVIGLITTFLFLVIIRGTGLEEALTVQSGAKMRHVLLFFFLLFPTAFPPAICATAHIIADGETLAFAVILGKFRSFEASTFSVVAVVAETGRG